MEVDENLRVWGDPAFWEQEGDNWSEPWGGTSWAWHVSLLPRIHRFVPAGTVLEIAPGYGRWSQFLARLCERLMLVDLVPACIEHCRQRFRDHSHIEYYVNDGKSLAMIPDRSIDFVFSFDSLPHAERDVVEAYVRELAAKLKPSGVAFLHHSNAGTYGPLLGLARSLPDSGVLRRMANRYLPSPSTFRAETVTAEAFREMCRGAGLACISQELIPWGPRPYLTDCLSLVAPRSSSWSGSTDVLRNHGFSREQRRAKALARLYGREAPAGSELSRAAD